MQKGVVVAGGGLAGQRCVETLRRVGYEGRITMVCAEEHPPYDRPPLSKEVLQDPDAERSLQFRPADWYRDVDVDMALGVRATALDARRREVTLSDGSRLRADRVLVATGGRPRTLAPFADRANVTTLRTLEDARRLRAALSPGARLAIIGAGFIGLEVAAAGRAAGVAVTVVEAARLPLLHVVGARIGRWLADVHRREGVQLLLGRTVAAGFGEDELERLVLDDGTTVPCDHVLVGVGTHPDIAWTGWSPARAAAIPTDDRGGTTVPGVFAAGDAAAPFDPVLCRHVPCAHWEAAGRMGARVAKAMLGLDPGAAALSSFWSDQYGTRIQCLGHASVADDVSVDGDPRRRDFSAVFTRAGTPVAAVLAGRPQELPNMRRLLTSQQGVTHDLRACGG